MVYKIFLFLIVFVFAEFAEKALENGFFKMDTRYGVIPTQVNVSVLTLAQASALFQKIIQNPSIPFKYPIDGCYARATKMAQMAEKEHINLGKVFVDGKLQVKTDLQKYPIARWGWHVAPVAYVRDSEGKNKIMVFDPSMFHQPVPLEDWKKKMLYSTPEFKPHITSVYFGTKFQYMERNFEKYKGKWDSDDLRDADLTSE